ncbi:MAG: hypothetical protein RLY93_06100 [Sumerlaeia bacterium]
MSTFARPALHHPVHRLIPLCVLAFLAGTLLSAQPPAEGLDWTLERRGDGTIVWRGKLPPAAPRSTVEWRARAVWTAAEDAATTRLLADTGTILSIYYPRHDVPLSVLSPPPGDGLIVLELSIYPRHQPIRAHAFVHAEPNASFDDLLAAAEGALAALEAEALVASRYGVRRPEGGTLIELSRIYLRMAQDLDTRSAREDSGRRWLDWIARGASRETAILQSTRKDPAAWTPLDDPPLWDLRFDEAQGQWRAAVAMPRREVLFDVTLVAMAGDIAEHDLALIKALGFNAVEAVVITDEFRLEADRLNLAILQDLPAREGVVVVSGWAPFDESQPDGLAAEPWRLWRLATAAMQARRTGRWAPQLPPEAPGPRVAIR